MARTNAFEAPLLLGTPEDWICYTEFLTENTSRTLERGEKRTIEVSGYFTWMAAFFDHCCENEDLEFDVFLVRCRELWESISLNEQLAWARMARGRYVEIARDVRSSRLAAGTAVDCLEIQKVNGNVVYVYTKI